MTREQKLLKKWYRRCFRRRGLHSKREFGRHWRRVSPLYDRMMRLVCRVLQLPPRPDMQRQLKRQAAAWQAIMADARKEPVDSALVIARLTAGLNLYSDMAVVTRDTAYEHELIVAAARKLKMVA